MADKIFFKTGEASKLPSSKTTGQLLFAIDKNGTSGSIYLDKDSNTRVKFNSDALKLVNERTINGAAFDGTQNITTNFWGTARNIKINDATNNNSGAAVSVDGSKDLSLKLPSTIKATLDGNAATATKATTADKATVSESTTGNAATATILATGRAINGTTFNGSQDITTTKWGTARNISITDSTAEHTGAAVSVNGSAAAVLKLPATITATLIGNASTATKATTADKATVSESTTGNAATATKLQTARTINGTNFDGSQGITTSFWGTSRTLTIGNKAQTVNGSANVSWDLQDILLNSYKLNASTDWNSLTSPGIYGVASAAVFTGEGNPEAENGGSTPYRYGQLIVSNSNGYGMAQFYISHQDGADNQPKYGIKFRTGFNKTYINSWRTLLDSVNFSSYALSKTGNAVSASKLQTAREINGTAFDGTIGITTVKWGTKRNVQISDASSSNTGTAVSVDGSAGFTLYLPAAIKATLKGNADTATKATSADTATTCTGNAATATKLATARSITLAGNITGSTSFDGSANVSISTTIANAAVSTAKVADKAITNIKLANSSLTIAGNSVSLGGTLEASTLRTSLGLSSALRFIGIATVAISDGSTTDPVISGYTTKTTGDVVIDKDSSYEYLWTGSKWERLGPDGSYKTVQTAVSDPTASGNSNTFIKTISQNSNGVITATKATIANLSINGKTYNGSSAITVGTLGVAYGGTGTTSLTSGYALIGNGTGAVQTRAIVNNTTMGPLGWASASTSTELINRNTLAYWNGAYTGTNSNLSVLGTITTGIWNGSTIRLAYGGTGATTQSGAFTNIVAPGGTTTGPITAKGSLYIANNTDNAFLSFIPTNFGTTTMGRIYYYAVPSKTNSYFEFHNFSRSSSDYSRLAYADVFQLPSADADKTAYSYYKIITTKNPEALDGRWLKLSGGVLTGSTAFKSSLMVINSAQYPSINFYSNAYTIPNSNAAPGTIYYNLGSSSGISSSRFMFRQYSSKSSGSTELTSYYEDYVLPYTESGKTSSGAYNIYTSKNSSQVFNDLPVGQSAMPQDNDYFISQYVGGGTTNTTYYRHSMSKMWAYINSKLGTSAVGSSTQPIYWNGSKPIACGAISIANGGTGATNVTNARLNLMYLGNNPITSTTNDTITNWRNGGLSLAFFSSTNLLVDQPSQYGLLLNVNTGTEVHQIWMTQASGNLCHRGGNANGWQASWRTILDSTNYSSYALPLSGGTLTGELYTNSNLISKGGFYVRNNATRPTIYFSPTDTNTTLMELAYQGGTDHNNFRIRQYSKKSGTVNKTDGNYYEEYQLPDCTADRTSSKYYTILTNKNTVTVSQGGTGLTASPSMLVNLGSTSAANVLQASPRPGVTGTLPIANGGTGANNAATACSNLGAVKKSGDTMTGALTIQNDSWKEIKFTTSAGKNLGALCGSGALGSDNLAIKVYSADGSDYADHYLFPRSSTYTSSYYYNIYTSKNLVYSSTEPTGTTGMIWLKPA